MHYLNHQPILRNSHRSAEFWEGFNAAYKTPPSKFKNPYCSIEQETKHKDYRDGWDEGQFEVDYLLNQYPS
jgi:hypothetical protein